MRHIVLPALDNSGNIAIEETLEVEPVGEKTLQLLHSPAFVGGLAGGDIIELDGSRPSGFRLVTRGGFFAVVVSIRQKPEFEGQFLRPMIEWLKSVEGTYDGGPDLLRVLSIPVSAGLDDIRQRMDDYTAMLGEGSWWFGNADA